MSKYNEVIYCLAEIGGDPFYVGRTNDWHKRWKDHISCAKRLTCVEAKYQHIRTLWKADKDFELIVLDEKPKERYERWWHHYLGVEFDLKNQKLGDTYKVITDFSSRCRRDNVEFTNADEYLTALDLEIAEARARAQAKRTQDKVRSEKIATDVSRTLFIGEKVNERFMSPGFKAMQERRKQLRSKK